jgi:hypothetical protein
MKRFIAAASFALLAVPAVAAQPSFEPPFEQTLLDRRLPDVQVKVREARAAVRPSVDYNFVAPAL